MAEKKTQIENLEADMLDRDNTIHEQQLHIKELDQENRNLINQVEKLNIELNELNSNLNNRKGFSLDEIKNLMEDHQNEKDEWEKIRESQYYKIQEYERQLRQKSLEMEGLRKQFYKISEILQTNVSKSVYETLNAR